MIQSTEYTVDPKLLQTAVASLVDVDTKETINQPSGDFFYDSWQVKDHYKNTVWEEILSTIKQPVGEARIITLESGTNYYSHADIDDRWHLNLDGNQSYLIDLHSKIMFETKQDYQWYLMNAGILHTAANFGQIPRRQLVVRKLLYRNKLTDPMMIEIEKQQDAFDYRYQFDHKISPWLNMANKQGYICDFTYTPDKVKLTIEKTQLPYLIKLLGSSFGAKIL